MKRPHVILALLTVLVLAGCVSGRSAGRLEAQEILGTWSGHVAATYAPNSRMQREGSRASGGWTFYTDGSVITSRGVAGRWRLNGHRIYLLWDADVWGPNTRGPRRIHATVVGESLTAGWSQVNTTHRERYAVRAEFRRLAPPPGMCSPPDAPPEEMRHAVLIRTIEAGVEDIRDVRFSSDATRLAVGSNDARVRLFDVASGRLMMQSPVTAGPIWNVAFARDDHHVVSFGPNGGAFGYHLWDPATAEGELTTDYDALWNVTESYFPESRDQTLRYERGFLYSRATGMVVAEIPRGDGAVVSALFSHDGGALVVRHGLYETRVFDGRTGAPRSRLCGTTSNLNAVRVTADGAYLATGEYHPGNSPHVVAVWHVASGAIVARLRAPYNSLEALDISPNADLLATGSEDGRVRIWRLAAGPGPIPLIGPSLTR